MPSDVLDIGSIRSSQTPTSFIFREIEHTSSLKLVIQLSLGIKINYSILRVSNSYIEVIGVKKLKSLSLVIAG